MNQITISRLGFEPQIGDYILHRKKDSKDRRYRILQVTSIEPLSVIVVREPNDVITPDYPIRIEAFKMTGIWEMKKINYLDVIALCI
jgi:hypothetical protein